jgi:thiomorpholine-carboxylate dehydrogenase
MRFISEQQVREVLHFPELIQAMREALQALSGGRVLQPVRGVIPVVEHNGWFGIMPAVYGDVMGAKLVTFYPGNVDLHTHQATIQLFRAATGEPLAWMDGRVITEMRTAAVSAVALDLLAARLPLVLVILGSGVQAHSHLEAFRLVRDFCEVRVWSRTRAHAEKFGETTGARVFESVATAVRDADVVVTLTSAAEPILQGAWLKPDAVVIAVGSVGAARRELFDDVMGSPLIVESRESAVREAGEVIHSGAQVYAEIGELLNGSKPVPARPAVYKSLGIAVEDLAAARLVYDSIRSGDIAN